MINVTQILLKQLDPGQLQNLAYELLPRVYGDWQHLIHNGNVEGTSKTRGGTPDLWCETVTGRIVYIQVAVDPVKGKIFEDVEKSVQQLVRLKQNVDALCIGFVSKDPQHEEIQRCKELCEAHSCTFSLFNNSQIASLLDQQNNHDLRKKYLKISPDQGTYDLVDILSRLRELELNSHMAVGRMKENVKSMFEIILKKISRRLEVYDELHQRGWDLNWLVTEKQVLDVRNALKKVLKMDDEFDLRIHTVIADLRKTEFDYAISHMCEGYVERESKQLREIETSILWSPQYMVKSKGKVFQVMLMEFIEELQREFTSIKALMEEHFGEIEVFIKRRMDRRDYMVVYDGLSDKYKKLATLAGSIQAAALVNYEIAFGEQDDLDFYMENSPVISDKAMIQIWTLSEETIPDFLSYLNSVYSSLIDGEVYSFSPDFEYVFVLFDLEEEHFDYLMDLKNRANLIFHFFVSSENYGHFVSKYPLNPNRMIVIE